MHLNLAEKNPSRLLSSLQHAMSGAPESLELELLGPGVMLPDTALMVFHVLRERAGSVRIHAHSHTCLLDGAILLWLAADTRSIRPDAWIQITDNYSGFDETIAGHGDYSTAVIAAEETAAYTDMRTIRRHLDEHLPVNEITGLRLFEADLADLGLIKPSGESDELATLFAPSTKATKKPKKPQRNP